MTAVTALASGSWAPGGAGSFRTGFSDPGGTVASFVSWALEYVSPLDDWLDELAGNEGQVRSFAATWREVAGDLDDYELVLAASSNRVAELEGRTARALRKRHDELRAVLADSSEWTTATAAALDLASEIVGAVHDAVIGALSELAGLVTTLFGFTLNPFDKVDQLRQLSRRALGFIEVVADLIDRMFDAFTRLVELLHSLEPLIAEGLLALRETLGVLLRELSPVLGGPVGGLLGGAASDLLAGDPRVTELDSDDLNDKQRTAYNDANGVTSLDSLSDLVTMNGYVDLMGGGDRGVVDIMEVVDESGEHHWVVALPSTQDWGMLKGFFDKEEWDEMFADGAPTNDLDSNIALMLMQNPELRTQYERAVQQAMLDAGVPVGADVVYTGFSQGGIMAATLASNPDNPFHTIGVVTNGSPIETFPIPPGVEVIRFEHDGDVVPHLYLDPNDLSTGNPNPAPNPDVVHLPAPTATEENDYNDEAHHNGNYVDSVEKWEAENPYQGTEPPFYAGEIVNHQQHTWSE